MDIAQNGVLFNVLKTGYFCWELIWDMQMGEWVPLLVNCLKSVKSALILCLWGGRGGWHCFLSFHTKHISSCLFFFTKISLMFPYPSSTNNLKFGKKKLVFFSFLFNQENNSWDRKEVALPQLCWTQTLTSDWSDGSHGFKCRTHD